MRAAATLALVVAVAGCATTVAAPPALEARAADGAPADPTPAAPTPRARGTARDGVIALRVPLDAALAVDTAAAFFRAIAAADERALADLTTSDATFGAAGRGPVVGLVDHWKVRLRRLKYGSLASSPPWRLGDAVIADAPNASAPADAGGAVVLHVPMDASRGGDRLFADSVDLVLRPVDGRWRIAGQIEDFQLP